MAAHESAADPGAVAHRAADLLATALEDAGFDVGVAFPQLRGGVDRDGAPIVDLGQIAEPIAARLTTILNGVAEVTGG